MKFCTGASKQKGDMCRKRLQCQNYKNFMTVAANGEFKNKDMDVVYKENHLYKSKTKNGECLEFVAKEPV
jgi:hypothetical protein